MNFKILIIIVINSLSSKAEVHPSILPESYDMIEDCVEVADQLRPVIRDQFSRMDTIVVTCQQMPFLEI